MGMISGVGVASKHADGTTVRDVIIGLVEGDYYATKDGLVYGYTSHAKEHVITFLRSVIPSTVTISAVFPQFNYDDQGNIIGNIPTPYVAVKGVKGPCKEVGVGRILWEDPEGMVYGFNQTMYLEFDVFGTSDMKIDQVVDQIALQLQKEKSTGGELWLKGFQDFKTTSSDPARGFRYDTAWDFRMQHQYAELWHARLTVRTAFDVAWIDKTSFYGTISQIIFGQTVDIPWEAVIGNSMAYLALEATYFGLHSHLSI